MKIFGKELTFNGNKVYHAGNKPTASEIGAAASSHTHNYAGSSSAGGAANSALTATKATQDSAGQQINKTYIKGLSVSGKTITYTKGDGTTGTITTQDTNTTYSTGTSSSLGLTKLYTGTGTATDGTMTQAAINTALSGKAASSHTHNYAGSSSAGGAANSANTLATARTINGTSFNGSANITTANWGTARIITIGSTGKSVNGSGSVSWTLREIGAAPASHGRHMPDTCETITDWNNATKNGWYMGNNATNSPTANTWYFGEVIAHNANYVVQTVYQFTASTDAKSIPKYIRAKMNGTWGAWTNVTVSKAVPSNAVFTDTNTWRGVQDNLTSTATDQSLSANQGKVLKGLIDGKAAASHTHNYAATSHNHGLLHDSFGVTIADTTTDNGWSMINGSYNGFLLKSIRSNASAPAWLQGNYSAGIAFGGADTKGVMSVAYSSPSVRFAGGNGSKPVWYFTVNGSSGKTYNMDSLAANTANTLVTARTINGTSFNGSANITTANWGTARNITIGNTTKSVNGSANVSWTAAEIGVASINDSTTATGTVWSSNKTQVQINTSYNTMSQKVDALEESINRDFVSKNGSTVTGNLTVQGQTTLGATVLNNNTSLYGYNKSGTKINICGIDTSNNIYLGWNNETYINVNNTMRTYRDLHVLNGAAMRVTGQTVLARTESNRQIAIVSTAGDGNGIGDGQTHLGYFDNGYHHYFRGSGAMHVDMFGGLKIGGKRLSIGSAAHSNPATGDVWIQV